MTQQPLDPALAREALEAYIAADGNQSAAAVALGLARGTFQNRLAAAKKLAREGKDGLDRILSEFEAKKSKPEPSAPTPQEGTPQSRAERMDAGFWRKRSAGVERDLAAVEHRLEQIAGLRAMDFTVPDWIIRPGASRRGKSVIGCLVSDVHDGEVISANEINGINAFNPEICERRMHRYFSAVCTIGQRWADDTECMGVLLALAGDLMSGDIHEELRITNAMTSQEQCIHVSVLIAAGMKMLLETYGAIHVVGVPGNHGRSTQKPTAKLYARLSYDNLILAMVESHFKDDKRVTFQYGAAKDQMTPVFGRTVFTTHGDKIGTKGGMGFAGPVLPIVRGSKKIEAQQAGIGRRPDLIQFGHYHTTANPGNILANGSVPGYSEYADDLRAVVEPPQQWAYLLHDKWWMRERMPIQLEDPAPPQKPRVTVPAGWAVV